MAVRGLRKGRSVRSVARCGHNGGMSDSPAPLADPHLVFDPVASDGPRDIVILGSTGSIGTQAIDLVLRNPDRFRVTGALRRGRQGRAARRAGAPAAGAHRRGRARGRRAGAARGAARASTGTGEPLPEILAGPDAATRARRLRVPHRAQRHHRLHRPRAHPRRARGGPDARARQQGVADRRRPAGQGARQAGPDHPGRLRARRALPGARRAAPAPRCASSSSPRPAAPSAAVRRPSWPTSPRATPSRTPPGPWARSSPSTPRPWSTRGWRSSRRTCSTTSPSTASRSSSTRSRTSTRWWSSRTARRSPRRRPPDMRGPIAHRPRLARAGPGRGARLRLDEGVELGVLPAGHRGVPVGRRSPATSGSSRRHGPGGVQCGERGVRGRVPGRTAAVQRDHGYGHRSGRGARHAPYGNLADRRGRPRSGDLGAHPGP